MGAFESSLKPLIQIPCLPHKWLSALLKQLGIRHINLA